MQFKLSPETVNWECEPPSETVIQEHVTEFPIERDINFQRGFSGVASLHPAMCQHFPV